MAIEGFDTSLLIESAAFMPQVGIPQMPMTGTAATLDVALAQIEAEPNNTPNEEAVLNHDTRCEATALDLWISDAIGIHDRQLKGVGMGIAAGAFIGSDALSIGSGAPEGDALISKKLSMAEMGHVIGGGRQFDSTDYMWEETSTGDYEWALTNFQADVYAGVRQVTSGAATPQEAAQLAQAYLNSIGLGSVVHVNNPAAGTGEEIVVTASSYNRPAAYMPVLSMDPDCLNFFDPRTIFDLLDMGAHTVTVDFARPLTAAETAAIQTLINQARAMTTWLNSLPANATFTLNSGSVVTATELRSLWALTDFKVVDNGTTFPNGSPTLPGVGLADWNNENPIFTIRIGELITYMANQNNVTLYILHELAHVTLAGRQSDAAMYFPGSPGGTTRTSAENLANEQLANLLAREIARAVGHGFTTGFTPSGGYGSATVTYSSGAGGTAGGGTGGGTGGGGGGGGGGGQANHN